MKLTLAAVAGALLSTSVLAAPESSPANVLVKKQSGSCQRNSQGKCCKPKQGGMGMGGGNTVIPYTSTFSVTAVPEQVIGDDGPTGGLEGARGQYEFGLNTDLDLICYYIVIENFRGDYQSAADTSTHIHEAPRGENGPPRIAFPNPEPVAGSNTRISAGCLSGPFTTGLEGDDGQDTGAGFTVAQIEANPSAFFADVHSSLAVPGAVRGQIQ